MHDTSMLIRSLLVIVLLSTTSAAQVSVPPTSPATPVAVADSTLVPFDRPNGSLLHQGTVVYDLTSTTRAGQATSLGMRTVGVAESTLAGTPAWLLTESRTGAAVVTTDSLYLTRGELAPLRWSATSGRSMLGASFNRDTMFGALQSYQGRSSFTAGVGPAVLVTPGMVERVLELLPLHMGYRVLASLLVVEMGGPRAQPAELVVDREERVQLGDQAVDCWVVAVRAGTSEERLWVSKDAMRVVKTEQAFGDALVTAVVHVAAPVVPGAVVPPVTPPVSP